MIDVSTLKADDKSYTGLRVDLPDSSAPLVMLIGDKGIVVCGFLNLEVAEKLSVAAAMVLGVKSFDDVLNAQIKAVTSKAKSLGVDIGLKGSEAISRML